MKLAVVLFVVIVGTHYGYAPLASFYADPDAAARAIFYAARGIEGAVLFSLIGYFSREPLALAVCFWGALEEGETAVCRLTNGIESSTNADLFGGLCGSAWYWSGLVIAALFAMWIASRR